MRYIKGVLVALILLFVLSLGVLSFNVSAQSESPTPTEEPTPTVDPDEPTPTPQSGKNAQEVADLEKQIEEYESKIEELQGQEKTLSDQISVMDNQIKVTELRIDSTKKQIEDLQKDIEIAKNKVSTLQSDINNATKALIARISAVYQVGKVEPWQIFLSANTIDDVLNRLKYLRVVQIADKRKVYAAEQAKNDYTNQKQIYEDKEAEAQALNEKLEGYTKQLDQEKDSKKVLLAETQGSEAKFQKLLAQARAEYQAIQGIVAGKGTESEIGKVSEGQKIASIIPSASCNSSGPHVHFIVRVGGSAQNPFNYLKPVDHSNQSNGDTFNPSGSWNWPIDPPIQFNQGYGSDTWYVRTYHPYPFHDGIDISGSSYTVKAVKSGTLYRGSYSGNGGCTLPYVRVKHDEGGIDTLYLHVYSI